MLTEEKPLELDTAYASEEAKIKVQETIDKFFDYAGKSVEECGQVVSMILFFDENGYCHSIDNTTEEMIFDRKYAHVSKQIIKEIIKRIEADHNTKIVETMACQMVSYIVKADLTKAQRDELMTNLKTNIDSIANKKTGVIMVRENHDRVDFKMYGIVHNEDESSGVLSNTPEESSVRNKADDSFDTTAPFMNIL